MTRDGWPSPWKLGGLSVRELASRVWREINDDEVSDRAAALSYYLLFALFPALLFLTALLGYLPVAGLQDRLLAYTRDVLPRDAYSTLERTLNEIVSVRRGGLLSIGVLAALWAGSNGMVSVMTAMNNVVGATERRSWWRRRLIAVALTAGFSAFIIASLVLIVFGRVIGDSVADHLGLGAIFTTVWNALSIPLTIACALIGIELVYYLAPSGEQRWRWFTPGATLALVTWLAMSWGLRTWATHFGNYSATYGSIGGVILLMLWFYLTSYVLLVGAEIDSEIDAAAHREGARPIERRAA